MLVATEEKSLELWLWHSLMHFHAYLHSVNQITQKIRGSFFGRNAFQAGEASDTHEKHLSSSFPNRWFGQFPLLVLPPP